MVDPLPDLIVRLASLLSCASKRAGLSHVPVQRDLARALNFHESDLSGIKRGSSRRTTARVDSFYRAAQNLIDALQCSSRSKSQQLEWGRVPSQDIHRLLGPHVSSVNGALKLERLVGSTATPERWDVEERELTELERFLVQDKCQSEDRWVAWVRRLQGALDDVHGKHDHPHIRNVVELVVRAAHCSNAMTPIGLPDGIIEAPSHRLLMQLVRGQLSVMKRRKMFEVAADAHRVLGFANHAFLEPGLARREFGFALRYLERNGQVGGGMHLAVQLALEDLLLSSLSRRAIVARETVLEDLASRAGAAQFGRFERVVRLRAGAAIMQAHTQAGKHAKRARKILEELEEDQRLKGASRHVRFEFHKLRSAALFLDDELGQARAELDEARCIAEEAGLISQQRRYRAMRSLTDRRSLGSKQKALLADHAIQGGLRPHRGPPT